ncbi:NAC domain-containing protein 82-like [Rhodamnia argentea]|uniref:NAC domain-containing protein 82-like n=1 Tax=Rhodamnia argentea TaxID=178133 RepID=A0ABM3GVK8_9MYRT|nr:NAC domain-containing protein 82-like [Rhodamnia argentea]
MARTSLPPGFRFHPTDVELVEYYLKRKVLGKKFRVDAIAEVDIYKFAPWDLPDKACLRTKDLKWYFFCPRERKYATGGRTNRSTEFGFWKTTGNDRPVNYKGQPVGMIKSLIFHRRGGEPKPERTDWVMHEYRLDNEDLKTKGVAQDAFVICIIYQKDGPGPRNGAQYGAPYNEEEWDDDGEADCPSTSSFTQAFILPDKQKQTVDIGITGSEQYCGRSTSKACPGGPSEIAPPVVNVPPPALPNDVTMEDLLSHGIFGDEIPAVSSENDKVENLDHINPDGNHQAELAEDDIFVGLDDLGGSLAILPPNNNGVILDIVCTEHIPFYELRIR